MNIDGTSEKKSFLKDCTNDVLIFGIIAKIYCPKHVGIQINQIIAQLSSQEISFPVASKNISNLITDYSLAYQVWLSILNRNPLSLLSSREYQVIKKIVELFQLYESQSSLFNYLFIVINNFQKNNLNLKLLHDILDLHSRFTSQLPASELLELTIELVKVLPMRYDQDKIVKEPLPVTEEDIYTKSFPPSWCIPHESIQSNRLLNKDKESDSEGENLEMAPKIDQSYVKSTEIVPCKGFPLYLTNSIGKSYSVGSEGDNYTVERESHHMYSNMLQIMFDKFENLVIKDDHFDAVLSLGAIAGIRQRILFHELYGDIWPHFDKIVNNQRKLQQQRKMQIVEQRLLTQKQQTTSISKKKRLDYFISNIKRQPLDDRDLLNTFSSATLDSRCRSSIGKVLKSQYRAASELEAYLRSMPDFDLSEYQTFSMANAPISFKYESTISACVLLEEILSNLPHMAWFFDKVIPRTRFISLDSLSSISMICDNSLANALYYYARCIKLLFKFLPLDPPDNQEFIHYAGEYVPLSRKSGSANKSNEIIDNNNINENLDYEEDEEYCISDPYIDMYKSDYMKKESNNNAERTIFDDFFASQPDQIHIDTYLPQVDNENKQNKSMKKSAPFFNFKEDRYFAAIENFVFYLNKKYDYPLNKSFQVSLSQKFIKESIVDYNQIYKLEEMIGDVMDRFGSNTKYFVDFCYTAQRLSAMASAIRASNEWKNIKKLLLKYGTISSARSEVLKENFPRYLFDARQKLHFPSFARIDFSVETNEVRITPLG